MLPIIPISLFALIFCIAATGWIIGKQHRRLDRLYHDALHAESNGHYAAATALYQSILDKSGFFLVIDHGIRALVKSRMNTLRHEQDWLSQFLTNNKMP